MTFIGIDGGGTTTRGFIQQDDAQPMYHEWSVSLKIVKGDFIAAAKKLQQLVSEEEVFGQYQHGFLPLRRSVEVPY